MMTKEVKIHLALIQLDNIVSIIEDLEYIDYMYNKITMVKIELERQLSLVHANSH